MYDDGYRIGLWPLAVAFLLILPSYIYIAGLNITYLYPLFLLFWCIISTGKIKKIRVNRCGVPVYWAYLIYVAIMASSSKGVIYGLTTGCATVGMAYLISWVINSESRLNGLIDCILGITCVCCFLGIFEAITSINPLQLLAGGGWTFFTDYRMGIRRVAVQFGQPIIYGLFLMLVSPLAIYRITCGENRKVIRRAKIIYALMCINVVLTVSRAPIFVFLLLQLILWYQINRSKFIFRAIWILVFGGLFLQFANLLGLGIADWIDKFSSMFLAIFGTSESSDVYSGVANRFEIFDWVSKTVGSDIWFGKGVDAIFQYKVHEWQIKESIENEYLNTFFHLGIVGVVFEIIAFLTNVIHFYRKGRSVEPQYQRMNLLKSIAITLLCYYIVISTCGESSAITIHIFLLSIAMVYSNLIGEKEEIGL